MNPANPQFTNGLAVQGPWLLAWVSQVGSRHLTYGKPCEDNLGHRFHANHSIALAIGDGVSGGAAGEIASFAAVRYCIDYAPPATGAGPSASSGGAQTTIWNEQPPEHMSSLQDHLNGLDEHVQQAIAHHTGRAGASTVAAVWLANDGTGWLTHMGDVRAYCFSAADRASAPGAPLQRLTIDHTYANLGEAPPPYVPVNNPARMVGNGIAGIPRCQALSIEVGQALLLCTDGLHGFVTDAQIAAVLATGIQGTETMAGGSVMALTRRLLRLAVKHGSEDDIAAALLWRCPSTAQTESRIG